MIFVGFRRTLPLAFVVVLVLGAVGRAETFAERAFDPPAGSRWTLASVETAEEVSAERTQTTTVKTLSKLSYDEKTADGYRVTYVLQSVESSGTLAEVMGASSKPLESIVIHAMLNRNGMPLRIENADDVQAAVNAGIERILEPLSGKPQIAAALRRAIEGRLNARDPHGAGRLGPTFVTRAWAEYRTSSWRDEIWIRRVCKQPVWRRAAQRCYRTAHGECRSRLRQCSPKLHAHTQQGFYARIHHKDRKSAGRGCSSPPMGQHEAKTA